MSGLTTWPHRLPFQCTIRGLPMLTAQAFVRDVAATPRNTPTRRELGNGACFHTVPFQCKISGLSSSPPTAHAFAADVAATPNSSPSAGLIGIRRAVVPARRTMRFLGSPPCTSTPAWPTAHPPPVNVATAFNPPRAGSAGLLTVLQPVPFQWARMGLSLSVLSLEV